MYFKVTEIQTTHGQYEGGASMLEALVKSKMQCVIDRYKPRHQTNGT